MATYDLLDNPRGKRGKKSKKGRAAKRGTRKPTVSARRRAAAKKAARTRKLHHAARVRAGKKAARTRKARMASGRKRRASHSMGMPVYTPASHQLAARNNPGGRRKPKKGAAKRGAAKRGAAKRGTAKRGTAKRGTAKRGASKKRPTAGKGLRALKSKVSRMDKRLHHVEKDVSKIDHAIAGAKHMAKALRSGRR